MFAQSAFDLNYYADFSIILGSAYNENQLSIIKFFSLDFNAYLLNKFSEQPSYFVNLFNYLFN